MPHDSNQRSNTLQRVWDVFPPYPGIITVDTVATMLPFLARQSVVRAIKALSKLKRGATVVRYIELAPPNKASVYRRVKGVGRPIDMRGHHGKSGRPRKERVAA